MIALKRKNPYVATREFQSGSRPVREGQPPLCADEEWLNKIGLLWLIFALAK
jgi:hypothetical protein